MSTHGYAGTDPLTMTPDQIRIRVAEECGFCFTRSEQSGGVEEWHDANGRVVHKLPRSLKPLPRSHSTLIFEVTRKSK